MLVYLLNAVQKDGQFIKASTDDAPSLIDVDRKTFESLEAMNVARLPTENEVRFFKAIQIEDAEVIEDEPEPEPEPVAPKKPAGRAKAVVADPDLSL